MKINHRVLTVVAVRSGVAGSTRTRVPVDTVVTRSAILTHTRTAVVNVCQSHKNPFISENNKSSYFILITLRPLCRYIIIIIIRS